MNSSHLQPAVFLTGELHFRGALTLHGNITGQVPSHGMFIVAKTARIDGEGAADPVPLYGSVHENIDGAAIDGACHMRRYGT